MGASSNLTVVTRMRRNACDATSKLLECPTSNTDNMEAPQGHKIDVTEVCKEVSQNVSQFGYRPRPEDLTAIYECWIELCKVPAIELTVGATGGFLVGTKFGSRVPAACIGMYLCYNMTDRRPAAEFCLHRIMSLPTPLGVETAEIVRAKDENSHHLRQIKETSIRSKRIASDAATSSTLRVSEKTMPAERRYEPDNASTTQDALWTTSDPFDICLDSTSTNQTDQVPVSAKHRMEDRRNKRQEAYAARRESRRQQRQDVLLDGKEHMHDMFSQPSRLRKCTSHCERP